MGQTHVCQQAGQPGKESFQLGITGKGDVNPLTSEDKRDLVINKTGMNWAHLKCMPTNKGVVRRQHDRGNFHTFTGKSAQLGYLSEVPVHSCLQHGKQCPPVCVGLQSQWHHRDKVG